MFRPLLGHHQVVLTSLKSTVHEAKLFYCDDEISFITRMSVNLFRVKVVRIGGSRFWVWDDGENRTVLFYHLHILPLPSLD